ncbi:S8 family serine peptidase [Agromyces cerinus]|uniref:Serine protease, subtilisin family n=1 Tax=Agromyces cerinus subsp. cerinus TaxID=232089 RepID=A0A1N6F3F5_9MICO|nr:S8 family serine peptidase [Agromyces cerinus]SIN89777.1 Serine protease, subtilisin family [Agromyces cerinus subsp. cerinus]
MQRPSNPPRRHRRVVAAAAGIAIGIAGVGVAGLPAIAGPAVDDGVPPGGAITTESTSPGGSHSVTLITGDRVTVTAIPGGTQTVEVETVVPGAGYRTVTAGDELSIIPDTAQAYLASGALDVDLFNVTQLIEYGYDDASVDATPVIIELESGAAAFSAEPPAPGLTVGVQLASIGAEAATAAHAEAAATWAALTDDAGAPDARAVAADPSTASFGGGIAAIHLDGKVEATLDSSVPWIGAPDAWAKGYTGTGVTVAVLDTGYDDTHPDLAGRVLPDSTSFVPGEEVTWDPNGHGTHVASTIAGTGAASDGAQRGVADGANLLVGKVLDKDGSGQDSWIIDAMEWAAERAPIVSMSLGTRQPSDGKDLMSEALNGIAEDTGSLFVVAAGNSGAPETIGAPGAAARALTVGSVVDPSGELSWFSSQGPLAGSGALKPEIAGPGSDVTAARSADSSGSGAYVTMSGTSMATPHVAGAAAIVKQQHPEYTGEQLRAALTSTTTAVDLTAFQVGTGVVDVAEAVEAPVIAAGSGDFGMLAWGEEPAPVARTVSYTNRGVDEVVVDLTATLEGSAEVEASDVLAFDTESLTIPAGETRSATLTADPAKVPAGTQLSGALSASIGDRTVARTALGIASEAERHDLTVTATDFDGEPTAAFGVLYSHDAQEVLGFVAVDGEATLRLPAGRYALTTTLDLDREADVRADVLVGDPDFELDGDVAVAFDAREANPVTVDVGEEHVSPVLRRMDVNADSYGTGVLVPVWMDELWAQPMEEPGTERFDFTARWRLQTPPLTMSAGKESLDLLLQAGSTRYDGKLKAQAVDVGTGSVEEFAAVDVRGKVAIVTRSNAVSPHERAVNALDAGATMLLVANDADRELSEWVGADDGSSVAIPVAAISGVQGRAVLDALAASKGKYTVTGTGVANAPEIWDVARYVEGSIPEDLSYQPKDLARVDTTYYGKQADLVGEFRWDVAPNRTFGFGLPFALGRGIERTEWVDSSMDWYQTAEVADVGWQVRDIVRSYEPGERDETSYFGSIVRPYVATGYFAPYRQSDFSQVNLPSWGDGGEPEHAGAFDVFSGDPRFSQNTEYYLNGEFVKSSPFQGVNTTDLPDGDAEVRIVNTAVQDGSALPSSTRTVSEWTYTTSGKRGDWTTRLEAMIQAYYDVELDASGTAGSGRKKGSDLPLRLELGHVEGAVDSGAMTAATLEIRAAGGEWVAVPLDVVTPDSGAGNPPTGIFADGRAHVTVYGADLPVADAGGWIDLRVTAEDAEGNTFSQEIERALEIAPAKGRGR